MRVSLLACAALVLAGTFFRSKADDKPKLVKVPEPKCEDSIQAKATIDPTLDSAFFRTVETSRPDMIVEHSDGKLEDAGDGTIDAEDLRLIERTAQCKGNHVGSPDMPHCEAVLTPQGIRLSIFGDYASTLRIDVDRDLRFQCAYSTVYPSFDQPTGWRITKKIVKLKSKQFDAGGRMYAWIAVEFEELNGTRPSTSHRIEGFVKPFIQDQHLPSTRDSEQGAAPNP